MEKGTVGAGAATGWHLLSGDLVFNVLEQLNDVKALGRAACVDRTSWRAYRRLKRIPQWVSALSRSEDTDVAVAEACKQALGQIRCKPDVAFIFCTPSYDTAKLASGLRKALGDVQICGCTGAAVIATEQGKAPVLIEDDEVLSVSLVCFANQCEASVRYVARQSDAQCLPHPAGGEQQLVVLAHPKSGEWVNAAINTLCKGAAKSVVFGGLASGRKGLRDVRLIHSGGVADKGVLICQLTPKQAQVYCAHPCTSVKSHIL